MQTTRLLGTKRRTDDSRGVSDDERHLVRCAVGGRNEEISLIFAVIVVGHDDDFAPGEGLDRVFDALMVIRHCSTSKSASGLERPCRSLTDLPAMHQLMIGQHAR